MKIAHFADLHLDAPFKWADPAVAQARRQCVREALERVVEIAVDERVDALLCAGDLYEQDCWTPDTAAFLRGLMARVHPTPVFLAPGNHDWLGPTSLYVQTEWTDNVHVFTEDRLRPFTLADGLTLWGAAHRAPANTDGFLRRFSVDREGVHLAVFHGSEQSTLAAQEPDKRPHAPFDAAHIPAVGLSHVFCGHYHHPKDAPHHTYPGNPEPLSFGEGGKGGLVVATVSENGSITRARHRVSTTEVHEVPVDITGCSSQQTVRQRVASALTPLRGLARVVLHGEVAPSLDLRLSDLDNLRKGLDAVVYMLGDLKSGFDLESIQQEQTVRGQFVRDVLSADLDDDLRRRVVETGLRALAGRADLEVL